MPELARAWPLEIGAALMTAIEAAHGSDATQAKSAGVHVAGMDPPPWPSPLLTVFEDELIRRGSPTLTACGRILPYGTAGCDA